jgi:transcriptional regulator with XRE-family HTH domain
MTIIPIIKRTFSIRGMELRLLRKSYDISQEQLAIKLNTDQQTISNREKAYYTVFDEDEWDILKLLDTKKQLYGVFC